MSAEALGKSISEATKFLQTIHEDLRAQIKSLERLMSDRGWKSSDPNRVSYMLGNSLNDGKLWVIDCLERYYVRSEADTSADRVVAFVWYLYHDEGDAFEVPTLTTVAARFASPEPVSALFRSDWQIGPVFQAAGRRTDPVPLTAEQVRPFLPAAKSGAALIVSLCELTNEEVLLQRLVGPILTAEAGLGAAAPRK